MDRIIHLKDGNHIGVSVLEINSIPTASNLDADVFIALKKNMTLFAELLNMIAQGAIQQDTVAELLCVSMPVDGQVYSAKLHIFLVFRKHGKSTVSIQTKLRAVHDSCSASLQSSSYITNDAESSWQACTDVLLSIQEDSVLSLEKQVRTGTMPGQMGLLCYTNPYRLEEVNNFSRVYEAMSHFPGSAFSIQLVPTTFTQAESGFVHSVSYFIDAPMQQGRVPAPSNDAMDYYRRMQEVLDKPQYLYNIIVMGHQDAAMTIAGRLRSILQHEDEAIGLALIERSGNIPSFRSTFAMYPWNLITHKAQNPAKPEVTPMHFRRMVHMISAAEAMTFFHAPIDDGMITGIPINRIRMSRETFAKGVIDESNIQLGRLMGTGSNAVPFGAPLKGFTRHALVVGMPGTGKTTFLVNLLLQFFKRGVPFLVIEPTKSEYRALIDAIPDLQVFTPGKNSVVPFIINPFLPPYDITLETFKPSLISAFKAAFSMPSPLDILFANAMDACYVKHGWRSYSKRGDIGVKLFGLHEFVLKFREIIRNSNYSPETKGNMESAGVFRLLNLVIQNGNIYDTENSVPLYDLLRKPTIIELNAIDNQEQKALVMALLLINTVLYTKHNQAGDGNLKNILLIDEAHVLLGSGNTATQEGTADAGASTVKALQNMIVEIRSYGTGIIIADQSPQKVTKEVVGNTDVKVIFQLVQIEDKHIIAASSNMSEKDENQLSRLNTGEAYVYFRGLDEPVRIMTEDIREKESIRLVLPDSELQQRMHYWDDKTDLLKPYSQCSICDVCIRCDFKLRDDAKYFVDQMFVKDKPLIKDKQELFHRVVGMDVRLRELAADYSGQKYKQLLYCVCVRYIRKAALETPAILSLTEIERVLNRTNEIADKHQMIDPDRKIKIEAQQ